MRLRDFIKEHREEIDSVITNTLGFVPRTAGCYCNKSGTDHHHTIDPITNKDREDWVANDEGLSLLAGMCGVHI